MILLYRYFHFMVWMLCHRVKEKRRRRRMYFACFREEAEEEKKGMRTNLITVKKLMVIHYVLREV